MHLLQLYRSATIPNGEDSTKRWDRMQMIYTSIPKHSLKDFRGNKAISQECSDQPNISTEMELPSMELIKEML